MQTQRVIFLFLVFLFGLNRAQTQEQASKQGTPPSRLEIDQLQADVLALQEQLDGAGLQRMAVPWTFGAQYRVMGNASNFAWHPTSITNDEETRSFINQRFRTWVAFSPSEQVEGYLQMEVGHVGWGEDHEGTKNYDVAGDAVGIELRRGFLTYKSQHAGAFRVGIQDWHDAFGESATLGSSDAVDDYDSFGAILANSVWDFNVGGVSWSQTFPSAAGLSLNGGVFQLWEGTDSRADDTYLFGLDADVSSGKANESFGASFYFLSDRGNYSYPGAAPYASSWDAWFGLRLTKSIGAIPLRGWVISNTGRCNNLSDDDFSHTGFAGKLEAFDLEVGRGRFSAQVLYASGDDNPSDHTSHEFRTIAQSEADNFGAQGYWSYLALSSPHGPSDVNDLGIGPQNQGLGLATLQAKLAYPIADNFTGVAAIGWLASAVDNPANGKRYIGTEVANTLNWDLGGGLNWSIGGAFLATGDFLSAAGSETDDLWEMFTRFQLEF